MLSKKLMKRLIGWLFQTPNYKGLNNWLENRVNTLEEQLRNVKTDFENLKIIYKKSSCSYAGTSK